MDDEVGTRTAEARPGRSTRPPAAASSNGPWARRQAFHPSPRGPDLLVPRHVRILRCCIARAPHGDHGGVISSGAGLGAFGHRIRVALKNNQPGCARRVCRGEQRRPSRTRRRPARRTASWLPRSSSTAVMLSAHCSNVGSAPGVTGSDAPVPGWSKKITRPSDVIASIQPCIDGSSGMSSQLVNQFGTNTMSRWPSARRAIGDP